MSLFIKIVEVKQLCLKIFVDDGVTLLIQIRHLVQYVYIVTFL